MKLPLHQVAKRVTGKIQSGYDPFTGKPFKMVYQRVRKGLGNLDDNGRTGLQFRVQALITDKKSTAQLQSRARLAAAVTAYQVLTNGEKENLKEAALALHMTGYNLFIKKVLRNPQHRGFLNMARVTGPLFSQTAAGNMAKGALQFRADKWGSHVYKPQDPAKQNQLPPSEAQVLQRLRFGKVRDAWTGLGFSGQDYYTKLAAEAGKMNGWNLYLSVCLGKSIYPESTLLTLDGLPILNEYGEILQID